MNPGKPFLNFSKKFKVYGKPLLAPSATLQLAVGIPAKNEAQRIWKTLQSLAGQTLENEKFPSDWFEVHVLCNHCTDETREVCHLFQELHPEFPMVILETRHPEINNVGTARRVLMDQASTRLPENGFLIMTDADTVVDPNWLSAFLEVKNEPVDLICGVIKPDHKGLNKKAEIQLNLTRQYLDLVSWLESEIIPLQYDPWPRHSHNSGPNMAIRNSVYKYIGGIPPLACLEDIALFQMVISHGFKVRHSFKPVVTTSCRSSSRVPGGFGSQIRNWSKSRAELVEGLKKLEQRFKAFAEIKEYYNNPDLNIFNSICNRLHFIPSELENLFQGHQNSNSLIIHLENALKFNDLWNSAYPNIPIEDAVRELEAYFAAFSKPLIHTGPYVENDITEILLNIPSQKFHEPAALLKHNSEQTGSSGS